MITSSLINTTYHSSSLIQQIDQSKPHFSKLTVNFQKENIQNSSDKRSMRIENTHNSQALSFNELEFPAPYHSEIVEPYNQLPDENEEFDVSVRMLDGSMFPQITFSCHSLDVDTYVLSAEEQMMLNILLPGRQAKIEKCIKIMDYQEFVHNSIQEYQSQHLFKEIQRFDL